MCIRDSNSVPPPFLGVGNTASGYWALSSNTTGNCNTASGATALNRNTTGNDNTASGYFALERCV